MRSTLAYDNMADQQSFSVFLYSKTVHNKCTHGVTLTHKVLELTMHSVRYCIPARKYDVNRKVYVAYWVNPGISNNHFVIMYPLGTSTFKSSIVSGFKKMCYD